MRSLTSNRGKCVIYYPRAAAGDAHGQPQVRGEVVGQDGEGGHRQIILKISLKLPNIFVPMLCFTRVVRTRLCQYLEESFLGKVPMILSCIWT